MGFHSVIDKPDPVKRVMPPITTCIMIMTKPTYNQMTTERLFLGEPMESVLKYWD
jgi:hypothetical protein